MGGAAWVQERPLLYLNHDEKVFWGTEGPLNEWRVADPTQEPEVCDKLKGKGFGASVMVAMFVSVLGIFYWEVTRYGGKANGYWNGARMRRHTSDALSYADVTFPAVRVLVALPTETCVNISFFAPLCRSSAFASLIAARVT